MAGEGAETVEERLTMGGGGTLTLRRDGLNVRMEAERPADGRGLYKVWLHGEQGGKFLLGTLAPEGGKLRLGRTLSVSALERAGCWPAFRAEAPLAFAFDSRPNRGWYCEQHPDRLVRDPVLKAALTGPMLCRREDRGFSLALPFRSDRPLRLCALFCLARIERREGRFHLVWEFDGDGEPKVPHQTG